MVLASEDDDEDGEKNFIVKKGLDEKNFFLLVFFPFLSEKGSKI